MILSYLPVLIMLGLAIAFPLGLLVVTTILGPQIDVKAKSEPYECGVPTATAPQEQFPVKFYRVAILFLLFDVEVAFLFPWAVLFNKGVAGWGAPFVLSELGIFLLILIAGYIYAWKRGTLEWD